MVFSDIELLFCTIGHCFLLRISCQAETLILFISYLTQEILTPHRSLIVNALKSQLRRVAAVNPHLNADVKAILSFLDEQEMAEGPGRDLGYGKGDGQRIRRKLQKISDYAQDVSDMLRDDDELPGWVTDKVAVMNHDIIKIKHYLQGKLEDESHS